MKNQHNLLYRKSFTIRWQDMDAFNHVNHTIYFVYLQECRIDWLNSHNIPLDPATRGPIIAETSCKYLKPINYPAEIDVELYYSHTTGRRVFFEQVIRDKNTPTLIYATGQAVIVWVDFNTGRSISPPEEYNYTLHEINS
jgi:acyl-CoA thioester hydrolase